MNDIKGRLHTVVDTSSTSNIASVNVMICKTHEDLEALDQSLSDHSFYKNAVCSLCDLAVIFCSYHCYNRSHCTVVSNGDPSWEWYSVTDCR